MSRGRGGGVGVRAMRVMCSMRIMRIMCVGIIMAVSVSRQLRHRSGEGHEVRAPHVERRETGGNEAHQPGDPARNQQGIAIESLPQNFVF